uniref:Uncharacterized protein n=1 Tax=Manihot esculenta TaxID=3983 RepID=A0A2C9UZK2_MANES
MELLNFIMAKLISLLLRKDDIEKLSKLVLNRVPHNSRL